MSYSLLIRGIAVLYIVMQSLSINAQLWTADNGDGTYKNPVLFADYSDPDVVRVGDDFYMVASSFNCMPGIPVLHSKDLVNWKIVGHVYDKLPIESYDKPSHGLGSWAPSIRFHEGKFYVYFCTPVDGLFMATAENPAGPWSDLVHVANVAQWEDPCPFWDEDGKAYLVRGKVCADILYLHEMSWDGTKLLDNGKIIYHNVERQPVIEGPKFLKKDGYYYILSPAGGVPTGWQAVLRSKNIYGPYEDKIVLAKEMTDINGPHQGGLVELESGEWWFTHFQDRGAYGRIVHLQPVEWIDGWPIMGQDTDGNGIGEPVASWKKPDVGKTYPVTIPQTSDEFNSERPGLQWQWQANPQQEWYSFDVKKGSIRLYSNRVSTEDGNLWYAPNLLLQKFSSPSFTATTKLTFTPELDRERAGLTIMGEKYAYVCLIKGKDGLRVALFEGKYDNCGGTAVEFESKKVNDNEIYLAVHVNEQAECEFSYSLDGKDFTKFERKFQAKKGRWIGAKVGIFSVNPNLKESNGFADFDWFRME